MISFTIVPKGRRKTLFSALGPAPLRRAVGCLKAPLHRFDILIVDHWASESIRYSMRTYIEDHTDADDPLRARVDSSWEQYSIHRRNGRLVKKRP